MLRWRDVDCGSSRDDNRAVSSANVAVIISDEVGRSAVYKEYKRGPRTNALRNPGVDRKG